MVNLSNTPADVPRIPRHSVAVSGLITDPSNGLILLIRHPRRGWEFPGGRVEAGESLTEALTREVQEETGVGVSVGPLAGVCSNMRSSLVMFTFFCEWTGRGEPTTNPLSLEVEWVTREEAQVLVVRPPLRDRLRDMLKFTGQVVYRSYEFSAQSEEAFEYIIREERRI